MLEGKWFFVALYVVTISSPKGMWTMIYHIERGRTRQKFIVPFEAKPRLYLEFLDVF